MNKYEITYKIYPSAIFGLPQEGFTVISGEREIHGDTISTRSGKIVGFGTLSSYRDESEKINFKTSYKDAEIKFNDNFVTISFDENDCTIAINKANKILTDFLRMLHTFYLGRYFYAETIEFLENDKTVREFLSPSVYSFRLQWYNLKEFTSNLSEIFSKLSLVDDVAIRCLEYIDRASLLESINHELESFDPRTRAFLKSEIFLNYYKAMTVVLGDPTIDRDYQSRYQKFNILKDYYENEIKPLWKIRSDYDVAHYQLKENLDKLQKLIDNIDKVRKVVIEVFKKYLEYLKSRK